MVFVRAVCALARKFFKFKGTLNTQAHGRNAHSVGRSVCCMLVSEPRVYLCIPCVPCARSRRLASPRDFRLEIRLGEASNTLLLRLPGAVAVSVAAADAAAVAAVGVFVMCASRAWCVDVCVCLYVVLWTWMHKRA